MEIRNAKTSLENAGDKKLNGMILKKMVFEHFSFSCNGSVKWDTLYITCTVYDGGAQFENDTCKGYFSSTFLNFLFHTLFCWLGASSSKSLTSTATQTDTDFPPGGHSLGGERASPQRIAPEHSLPSQDGAARQTAASRMMHGQIQQRLVTR